MGAAFRAPTLQNVAGLKFEGTFGAKLSLRPLRIFAPLREHLPSRASPLGSTAQRV
jgi:hypothetical protein